MARLTVPVISSIAVTALAGCVLNGNGVTWRIEFRDSRDDAATFNATLDFSNGTHLRELSARLGAHSRFVTPDFQLPSGSYQLYATTGNATCGPSFVDERNAETTWLIELPELGRKSLTTGETWSPSRLNCVFQQRSYGPL